MPASVVNKKTIVKRGRKMKTIKKKWRKWFAIPLAIVRALLIVVP